MVQKVNVPKPLFSENGPRCVLLLHAYSGSSNDVRMLSRYLEKADYTVYSPLFAGHGTLDPLDILQRPAADWETDARAALTFLKAQGYQQIAVLGLSMGGIIATRMLEWQEAALVGGGFFCSPIFPVQTNVVENFLLYAENVLQAAGLPAAEVTSRLQEYRPLVTYQLAAIEELAATAAAELKQISQPFFMAQAGQDEMIEAAGVFQTAAALQDKRFVLQWYPESSHVITVGKERRQLEKDVLQFLNTLAWS